MNSFSRKNQLLRRTALATTLLLGVAAILGSSQSSLPEFTTPVIPDSADYTIDDIRIIPPPVGQPGQGTVGVITEFTLNAIGGNVSPIVWVWEHDVGNNFGPSVGSSGELGHDNPYEGSATVGLGSGKTLTAWFDFTCGGDNGNEVLGPNGNGTGEGEFDWWDWLVPQANWDDAEIRAAVAHQNPNGDNSGLEPERIIGTDVLDLSCAEVPPDSGIFLIQHSPN